MAQEILQSAHEIVVPDRAGQLIVQRKKWPVTVKSNSDTVGIGYLPAGCRLHIPACQVIFEADVPNCDIDVCLVEAANVLHNTGAHTTASITRAAFTTYELAETLGVSDENRLLLLLLNTAPASAAGNVIVDLAYFAPSK